MSRQNASSSSSDIYAFGCDPCWHCGGRDRCTSEFHGYWVTLCVHCGGELSREFTLKPLEVES